MIWKRLFSLLASTGLALGALLLLGQLAEGAPSRAPPAPRPTRPAS